MSKLKDLRKESIGKLNAIKSFNEKVKNFDGDFMKKLDGDAKDLLKNQGKKLQDFADKAKKKLPNTKNIFDGLISDLEKMIGIEEIKGESKIRKYTRESIDETINSTKQVVIDNVKKVLFANDSNFGCGTSSAMPYNDITIKPTEFDFLGTLKMDPATPMGTLLYEDQKQRDKVKMNSELYQRFDNVAPYTFVSNSGNDLFTLTWDSGAQHYNVTGLQGSSSNQTVDQFISQYYETIEFPTPSDIIKNSMAMLLSGDGTQTKEFDINMNSLNRILSKVMSACGTPNKDNELQQTAVDQFEEDEQEDTQFYFDFDDVDGIDLDDENLRYKRVLRFTDCNNFEVPINKNHIEDFAYLSKKDPLAAYNSTLNKVAKDAYNAASSSIPLKNFSISMNMMAVANLPKALLGSVFSAKIFLPLAVLWKMLKATSVNIFTSAKELIKNFSKLLFGILQDLFFKFITIFWKKVKPELIKLVTALIPRLFKKASKRFIKIIKSLLKVLTYALPFLSIKNCADLYQQILKLLDLLRVGVKTKISGFLLQLAKTRPGFSCDRATINVGEKLEANGVETGDLFGEPNNLMSFVQSILCGHQDEMDENSFVQISLDPGTIPVAPLGGAALISPLVKGTGILV